MRSGEIFAWRVAVGDEVVASDVVCEVRTDTLTEDNSSNVVLEIETHEDGFIAALLLKEGDVTSPDVPMCAHVGVAGVIPSNRIIFPIANAVDLPILYCKRLSVFWCIIYMPPWIESAASFVQMRDNILSS